MQEQIDQYTAEINAFSPANPDELETFRIKFLGTKGILKDLFDQFKSVGAEEKKIFGKVLNQFKQLAETKYNELREGLGSSADTGKSDMDLTLPGEGFNVGSRHPLSLTRIEIIDIFKRLGFVVAEGPEIEDDWHNFSALNFPEEHPARDMQDTFFIKKNNGKDDIALRTHTSSVQVRWRMVNRRSGLLCPAAFIVMRPYLHVHIAFSTR
jgi:phenylalanyl-tRNA synthetase alpha chain